MLCIRSAVCLCTGWRWFVGGYRKLRQPRTKSTHNVEWTSPVTSWLQVFVYLSKQCSSKTKRKRVGLYKEQTEEQKIISVEQWKSVLTVLCDNHSFITNNNGYLWSLNRGVFHALHGDVLMHRRWYCFYHIHTTYWVTVCRRCRGWLRTVRKFQVSLAKYTVSKRKILVLRRIVEWDHIWRYDPIISHCEFMGV